MIVRPMYLLKNLFLYTISLPILGLYQRKSGDNKKELQGKIYSGADSLDIEIARRRIEITSRIKNNCPRLQFWTVSVKGICIGSSTLEGSSSTDGQQGRKGKGQE